MSRLAMTTSGPEMMWTGKLLTLEDLRPYLASLRELTVGPKTIVSPLVIDELKHRKIAIHRDGLATKKQDAITRKNGIGYAIEGADSIAASAVKALEKEGISLVSWTPKGNHLAGWAWSLGLLVKEQGRTGAAFVSDPCLVSCIAGKVAGVRAAQVMSGKQASKAVEAFGANLLIVETGTRTFHEVKQILKAAVIANPTSGVDIERIFKEVDGHAHR